MTKKAVIGKFAPGKESILTRADIRPENSKLRITTFVSGDVLNWLKAEAHKKGLGYQTLLDMKLREMMNTKAENSEILNRILHSVESLQSENLGVRKRGVVEKPKIRATTKRAR